MDLLLASIQLWSGRASAALATATEAQLVFEHIDSDYGMVQTLGLLGRAHAAVGNLNASRTDLAECLRRALDMPGRPLESFARLVAAGGAVQFGDPTAALRHIAQVPDAVDDRRMIGSIDLEVTRGLAMLQQGDVDGAVEVLERVGRAEGVPSTYLDSSLALALVAADRVEEAVAFASAVGGDERATYLDRRTASLAAALAAVRSGDGVRADQCFEEAISHIDSTESRMSQAVVRLAQAIGHETLGSRAAPELRADAERALDDLGMHPEGWERAFRLAAGEPATPADLADLAERS